MGRGGLVGITTVYRMESRCARDITRLTRMARLYMPEQDFCINHQD
jgi:hypothetical protein